MSPTLNSLIGRFGGRMINSIEYDPMHFALRILPRPKEITQLQGIWPDVSGDLFARDSRIGFLGSFIGYFDKEVSAEELKALFLPSSQYPAWFDVPGQKFLRLKIEPPPEESGLQRPPGLPRWLYLSTVLIPNPGTPSIPSGSEPTLRALLTHLPKLPGDSINPMPWHFELSRKFWSADENHTPNGHIRDIRLHVVREKNEYKEKEDQIMRDAIILVRKAISRAGLRDPEPFFRDKADFEFCDDICDERSLLELHEKQVAEAEPAVASTSDRDLFVLTVNHRFRTIVSTNQPIQLGTMNTVGMLIDVDVLPRQGIVIFERALRYWWNGRQEEANPRPYAQLIPLTMHTALHEIGHALNLPHSWEQRSRTFYGRPIPEAALSEERTWMNYTYRMGPPNPAMTRPQRAQWTYDQIGLTPCGIDFNPGERLHIAHAPYPEISFGHSLSEYIKKKGNALFATPETISVDFHLRSSAQLLDPVIGRIAIINHGRDAVAVPSQLDPAGGRIRVIVAEASDSPRHGEEMLARRLRPMFRLIEAAGAEEIVLPSGAGAAGHAIEIDLAVERDGWAFTRPGDYLVQVACNLADGRELRSRVRRIAIRPRRSPEEQAITSRLLQPSVAHWIGLGAPRLVAFEPVVATVERLLHDLPRGDLRRRLTELVKAAGVTAPPEPNSSVAVRVGSASEAGRWRPAFVNALGS